MLPNSIARRCEDIARLVQRNVMQIAHLIPGNAMVIVMIAGIFDLRGIRVVAGQNHGGAHLSFRYPYCIKYRKTMQGRWKQFLNKAILLMLNCYV